MNANDLGPLTAHAPFSSLYEYAAYKSRCPKSVEMCRKVHIAVRDLSLQTRSIVIDVARDVQTPSHWKKDWEGEFTELERANMGLLYKVACKAMEKGKEGIQKARDSLFSSYDILADSPRLRRKDLSIQNCLSLYEREVTTVLGILGAGSSRRERGSWEKVLSNEVVEKIRAISEPDWLKSREEGGLGLFPPSHTFDLSFFDAPAEYAFREDRTLYYTEPIPPYMSTYKKSEFAVLRPEFDPTEGAPEYFKRKRPKWVRLPMDYITITFRRDRERNRGRVQEFPKEEFLKVDADHWDTDATMSETVGSETTGDQTVSGDQDVSVEVD